MTWHLTSDVSAFAENAGSRPATAATRNALDAGASDVVLFTDLANPTSNALYPRLGYRPIEDRAVVDFSR
ncbi:GNAT family N-acetyltransferase [Actinoplanes sp. CA-252034]|uniref:GNAT family N-acetyltransferase n=1 Tax=Actinoplanes sp. CA-252034 TaxID=3239906 RepID=UPI003D997C13